MSNENCLYGVDLSGEITPIQVRDAIVVCFSQAQEELKEFMVRTSELETEKIDDFLVERVIKNAFVEMGEDFNNPTKESLIKVIGKLKNYAKNAFRDPVIINKHAGEIMQLIDRLK